VTAVEPLERRVLLSYTRFAVIGDYSDISTEPGTPLADVAQQIKSWRPNFIATVGDNNYDLGAAETIDQNIGQYFHDYSYPYAGGYGPGSIAGNRFWPALGNHDLYTDDGQPYYDYFTLPGNERYYTVVEGNTQLFILNSDPSEVDGRTANSVQALWLKDQLADSDARWKFVLFHHSPWSSGVDHGSDPQMQWPFQQWGATAVITGHDHDYERIIQNGFPYFVNGLGGRSLYQFQATPVSGSQVRYSADHGAMRIDAFDDHVTFQFVTRTGVIVDAYTINAPATVTQNLVAAGDEWKYLDNGTDQGTAWRASAFDDSGWASGASQLGYGDGDESTTVSYGPNAAAKYPTTYFRKSFTVDDPSQIASLSLQTLRDDGVSVYLNGTRVFRSNLAADAPYNAFAPAAASVDENWFYFQSVSPSLLVAGTNVLAVEVHQSAGNSSDLSFNLHLQATLTAATEPPAPVSALRAAAASPTQINLSWIDTASNESGFVIERSGNGVSFQPIALAPAEAESFNVTPLMPAQQYWFRVRAYNAAGWSSKSSVATATTPALSTGASRKASKSLSLDGVLAALTRDDKRELRDALKSL
jgi:hypothetical protein